ncbi:MAG: WD40 repeat domain-containing protein [Cyclobacteriaceae bacterium]
MSKITVSKSNTFKGHRDCVYALAGSSGSYFFSSGGDGMIVRWDLDNPDKGELIAQVPKSVYCLKYVDCEGLLIIGQNFEGLQVIDVASKKVKGSVKLDAVSMFSIEIIGDNILVGMKNGLVYVLNIDNLKRMKTLSHSHESARKIAINPKTQEFAVGYSDNFIRIFDSQNLALKNEIEAHKNSVFALSYSPDGKNLLSGSRDAHLKVWETGEYRLKESIAAHMFALNDLVFSPNGKHFVTCSMDKSIKVWDYSTFSLLKVIDKSRHAGHGTSVNKLIWSTYNNQLISCSDDRTISTWDLKFS